MPQACEKLSLVVTPPSMSERELRVWWTSCLNLFKRTGDSRYYEQLYGYFSPRVRAYLLRLGVTDEQADELVQEAMLLVWRKAQLFDPRRSNASTWIFTLARNQLIDQMRRQKVVHFDLSILELEGLIEMDPQGDQAVWSDRLRKSLKQLPEAQAQALFLFYFGGYTHSEIAGQLKVPVGSVKSRLRLGCIKLRNFWLEK